MMPTTREVIRAGLIEAYKHQRVDAAHCVCCGRAAERMALHLIEYYQPDSAETPQGFVAASSSHGTKRGCVPICLKCAPACERCLLPVRTPWVTRMARHIQSRAPSGVTVLPGNGYCRDHFHVASDFLSLFKPVRFAAGASSMRINESRSWIRWLKTVIAGTVSVAAGGFTIGAVSSSSRYYEETSATVGWLVVIFLVTPMIARIWKRPLKQVAAFGLGVASFCCLWTAAGSGALYPFTKEQWLLLGITLLAAAGISWSVQTKGTA